MLEMILIHSDRDQGRATVEHEEFVLDRRIPGCIVQHRFDHDSRAKTDMPGFDEGPAMIAGKPMAKSCKYRRRVDIRRIVDEIIHGISMSAFDISMSAFDDVRLVELHEWNFIGALANPEERNQNVRSGPLVDEVAQSELVREERVYRIEVEKLSPLDFFVVATRIEQAKQPSMLSEIA